MIWYLCVRTGRASFTVLGAFLAVFIAIRMTPGGPAIAMLGQQASPADIERINREYGFDQPIPVQLGMYLSRVLRGDLGIAEMAPSKPRVAEELARCFPATIELSLAALGLAMVMGVGAGIAAAAFRNRWPDRLAIALASIGVSIPIFFLGILLLVLFPQMPGGGRIDVWVSTRGIHRTGLLLIDTLLAGRLDLFGNAFRHLVLPAVTLASVPTAILARVTRSSLLEVLGSDFVRAARAKGLGPTQVLFAHALPAAAVPIVSLLGVQFVSLLSGAVLTETVFGWPGIGFFIKESTISKDYNAIQAAVLLLGMVFILINLLTDAFCAWIDPRITRKDREATL